VKAALVAPSLSFDFRYDVLDFNNQTKSGVTPTILSAHVANNSLADIKRTATFDILDDGSINYLADRIKPYVRLEMPDGGWAEFPMGVFLLSTPPRHFDGTTITRQVQAYDQLQVLADSKVGSRYTFAAGSNYIFAVNELLFESGIIDFNTANSPATMPVAIDYEAGTSRLAIINDLLGRVNYRSIFFDADGRCQAIPYVLPDQRAIEWTYITDSNSVMNPEMEDALDLFGVPNQWIVVVSEPDRAVLNSTYTNSNTASPTSTVNRGRTIVKFVTQQMDAPDQATLDAITKRMAFEDSQVFRHFTFDTSLMPMHADSDVVQIVVGELGLNGRYVEQSWDMDLTAAGVMKHDVRAVVSV
jgi:hypothetical protein